MIDDTKKRKETPRFDMSRICSNHPTYQSCRVEWGHGRNQPCQASSKVVKVSAP